MKNYLVKIKTRLEKVETVIWNGDLDDKPPFMEMVKEVDSDFVTAYKSNKKVYGKLRHKNVTGRRQLPFRY